MGLRVRNLFCILSYACLETAWHVKFDFAISLGVPLPVVLSPVKHYSLSLRENSLAVWVIVNRRLVSLRCGSMNFVM